MKNLKPVLFVGIPAKGFEQQEAITKAIQSKLKEWVVISYPFKEFKFEVAGCAEIKQVDIEELKELVKTLNNEK